MNYIYAWLISAGDVKPDNVFINLREGDMRFSEVQLGDLGGCSAVDSEWATSGTFVGSPMWTSPEVILNMPWNTATDIWSFGATVRIIPLIDPFSSHSLLKTSTNTFRS
jgi:serine/threonine protein kinase